MILYFDIDETICITPENRDYASAVPIPERIQRVNGLFDSGEHTIVYWTARGSGSGKDWYDVTKNQLISWGAKHHELKLGKPMYDLFICDKAINSEQYFKGE